MWEVAGITEVSFKIIAALGSGEAERESYE